MNTEEKKKRIGQVLDSFKIEHSQMQSIVGTSLTLFEFKPAIGTKLSKIRNLKDEFTVALEAESVRIIAPIPGRGTVGIEVPHKKKEILPMAEILNSAEYLTADMQLPVALGKTITGEVFIKDLADMPHLLVAGATGQGKSVGLNVMLMSLLHKKTPEELTLVLIDPKQVELSVYNDILGKYGWGGNVITKADEVETTLRYLYLLMENRYKLFDCVGCRNIKEYYEKKGKTGVPYVVVVIDEYADLIMQDNGKKIEKQICMLAQKARAVGIHLIISTQRPSATIVTGNIKANFPTRIAFRTTTGTDSRVILDQTGAEKLTGNGDMLYFAGAETARVQCAYIDMKDVENSLNEINKIYEDFEAGDEFEKGNNPFDFINKEDGIIKLLKFTMVIYEMTKEGIKFQLKICSC